MAAAGGDTITTIIPVGIMVAVTGEVADTGATLILTDVLMARVVHPMPEIEYRLLHLVVRLP